MRGPHEAGTSQPDERRRDALPRRESPAAGGEARFAALVENGTDGIALLARDNAVLYVSPPIQPILGYDPAELRGRVGFDFLHPDDVSRIREGFARCVNDPGVPIRTEMRARHANGSWRRLEAVIVNRLGEPSIRAIVVNFRDVTERRCAEEGLSRLAAIVESSEDAIISNSLEGAILTWNAAAERIYGYTAEEAIGRSISTVVPSDRAEELDPILHALRLGKRTEHYETVCVRKDGARIEVSLSLSPIRDAAGRVIAASAIARDITERKRLELRLRQAEKMEAVGRFAGGIAHDFNNLLAVIIGYGDLVRGDLGSSAPQRANLEQVCKAAERAAALTHQLLAFSRRQVLQPRVLNLNSLVTDMEGMLRRIIGEDVQLVTVVRAALGQVKADPAQLEQVIMNLAVNARDAMPAGGTLTIETANVALDEAYVAGHAGSRPGRYVMLAVSDTGTGMDSETRSRIFEPFFTTKEMGKGTGLGLATVYGIVKQSEGYIAVSSDPGHGTTFQVYLPRVDQPVDASTETSSSQRPSLGNETVLLVEDDDAVRELLAEVLGGLGYEVLVACSSPAAIETIEAHTGAIHLLVTDVVMPAMSGRQLWEYLARAHPEARVLFISGYADGGLGPGGVLEPDARFLQKPFPPAALAVKVREILDGGRSGERP